MPCHNQFIVFGKFYQYLKNTKMQEMKKFAVIGYPLGHSKSPQIHKAGFQEFDIEASFEAVEVKPDDLKIWMEKEARNFAGFAVTAPHKEIIREFLDSETEIVSKIGAVNTVSNIDGNLVGTNTDAVGALQAILTTVDPKDKKVLILGAGGAAKAIAFGLKTAEAVIAIWNRTTEKAENLANFLDIGLVENLEEIEPIVDKFDIIINATSVGTKEWESVFPAKFWQPNHIAFDVVYDPLQTKFLDDAEQAGAQIITGDKFLIYQAIEQFKVWHNIQPEAEVFEGAFFEF